MNMIVWYVLIYPIYLPLLVTSTNAAPVYFFILYHGTPSISVEWYIARMNIVHVFVCYSVRLISLAAQKFISDVANDALQHCKMRASGQSSKKQSKVQYHSDISIPCDHYLI